MAETRKTDVEIAQEYRAFTQQRAADAELGAALRAALATVTRGVGILDGEMLSLSPTGHVWVAGFFPSYENDATRHLAALLNRSSTPAQEEGT